HHAFGTVEVRICDAQATGEESLALAGLLAAVVAQAAIDYDESELAPPLRGREIEENLWRAIRFGLDGRMIDFAAGIEIPTTEAVERVVEWTAPARAQLGIDAPPIGSNGAQRARAELAEGRSIHEVYADHVERVRASYAGEAAAG